MMEELVNMIASDASAADVSDQIKDLLYAKSAKKIDDLQIIIGRLKEEKLSIPLQYINFKK